MKKSIVLILLFLAGFTFTFGQTGGKISGLIYTDFFYNVMRDTAMSSLKNNALIGPKDANGFDLRRAYLTYDYTISESFNTRFRLEADGRTLTENKRLGVFVKDAWIKWKDYLPGQDIIFGIQPPPAYEISESYYGFRSLEKTIMDLRGIVSSRDFGLSLKGKITGDLNYWLLYGNNSGNSPETDKYKRLYGHLSIKPLTNLTATVYGDIKFRSEIEDPLSDELISNNVLTTAVFLGYSDNQIFSLGTEAFLQLTDNGYINTTSSPVTIDDLNGLGVSVFAWYKFNDKFKGTVRYDFFDPGLNEDIRNDSRNYVIAGLSYYPVDKLAVIPNVLIETYEELPDRQVDPSVTLRLTLAYEF